MLAAMDDTENELKIHIAHGKHNGLTDAQVDEIVTLVRASEWIPEPPKTFVADDKVKVRKVFYKNRYDILLAADLYMPSDMNMDVRNPALIIGHPFGAVKEQCAGLYAQEMAKRGFVTLAFDASYQGESGGTPRHTVSPDALVEDFSASVDWLGIQPFVDRERIGVIGICGSGSFAISAAKIDPRLKAIATISMYNMGTASRNGLKHVLPLEQRKQIMAEAAEQRYVEFLGGETKYTGGTVHELTEKSGPIEREFYEFYRTQRGEFTPEGATPLTTTHPTLSSNVKFMNFYPFEDIETISPRPMLFITGENAHSREFSEDAYRLAAEPKELYIVPGAGRVDLYDRVSLIPFSKLESFFKEYLKK